MIWRLNKTYGKMSKIYLILGIDQNYIKKIKISMSLFLILNEKVKVWNILLYMNNTSKTIN